MCGDGSRLEEACGDVIELSKTHRTRVVAFAGSLSLLMALGTGPAVVWGAMLRRIWDLILHIVRLRASVIFQFVFSHCGVPCNGEADTAAEQGNAKPQSYPACIADIVTGVERQVRNEMCRAFEEASASRCAVGLRVVGFQISLPSC
ncbi:hypothetical protein TRVL_02451 [Trypanosoma vivax]|nr:hypothetical protein TRVL_02451 [Trypanosoma vivax]